MIPQNNYTQERRRCARCHCIKMANGDDDGNDEATGDDGGGERATSAEVAASLRFAEMKISGARNSVIFEPVFISQ